MATRKVDMQRKLIEQQRDRLLGEIEALKNKVMGLELALSVLGGEEHVGAKPERTRGGLKATLTDLLREAGTTGLNATTAVEMASRRGIHLDKQSVSSTLSRMKGEQLVEYSGDRYRLVQFANIGNATTPADIVQLRPSGS